MKTSSPQATTLGPLRTAFRSTPIDEATLKDAISAFVDERRGQNIHVERVIMEIRRLAEVEDGPIYRALYEPDLRDHARQLINRAIMWTFERYFWSEARK